MQKYVQFLIHASDILDSRGITKEMERIDKYIKIDVKCGCDDDI